MRPFFVRISIRQRPVLRRTANEGLNPSCGQSGRKAAAPIFADDSPANPSGSKAKRFRARFRSLFASFSRPWHSRITFAQVAHCRLSNSKAPEKTSEEHPAGRATARFARRPMRHAGSVLDHLSSFFALYLLGSCIGFRRQRFRPKLFTTRIMQVRAMRDHYPRGGISLFHLVKCLQAALVA